MDRIRLFISIIVRNALWDKYNKNRIRSVGQWERKIGWDLCKHESHPITFVNNAIKLFKIGQWDAGLTANHSAPCPYLCAQFYWYISLADETVVFYHYPDCNSAPSCLVLDDYKNKQNDLRPEIGGFAAYVLIKKTQHIDISLKFYTTIKQLYNYLRCSLCYMLPQILFPWGRK